MEKNKDVFEQIAGSLANHFESVYYVSLESGEYIEYCCKKSLEKMYIGKNGEDYFSDIQKCIRLFVHPDDVERMIQAHDKDKMSRHLIRHGKFSIMLRLIIDGRLMRVRYIVFMASDQKHAICCMENIEEEIKKEEENIEKLQSARRMAKRDELTGVRNKNAYREYAASIEKNIQSGQKDYAFGIVVCDINDLKIMNDTRGHSFGDEAIQHASRMICETFSHSPVFRVGGDEFIIVLSDRDYEERETLVGKLKGISIANGRDRSGPVVACGMALYNREQDTCLTDVFSRADRLMYEDKTKLKTMKIRDGFKKMERENNPITDDRKRLLDRMFGAMYTIAGSGYVYLNDMRYDFSRWSLPLVDDFDMPSEYMYRAGDIWEERIHPEDIDVYRDAINDVFDEENAPNFKRLTYRARREDGTYVVCTTRGFVLTDQEGEPEYFGGIIIAV